MTKRESRRPGDGIGLEALLAPLGRRVVLITQLRHFVRASCAPPPAPGNKLLDPPLKRGGARVHCEPVSCWEVCIPNQEYGLWSIQDA